MPDQDQTPWQLGPMDSLMHHLGHFGSGHFGFGPDQIAPQQALDGLASVGPPRHRAGATAPHNASNSGRQKARIGPDPAQAKVTRQVFPQLQKESGCVVPAGRVAGSQPKLHHQARLRQYGQKRMQAWLESPFGIADHYALLLASLRAAGVSNPEIQGVTTRPIWAGGGTHQVHTADGKQRRFATAAEPKSAKKRERVAWLGTRSMAIGAVRGAPTDPVASRRCE